MNFTTTKISLMLS